MAAASLREYVLYLLYFFTYCFIGWCIESTIVSLDMKKFVNRGFLRIPMLPLYGVGAMCIISFTARFDGKPTMVFLLGLLLTTVLEYLTACLLEATFGRSYWDYNDYKYNFQGRVCVTSSLFWGFLSIFLVYSVHPRIVRLISAIPHTAALWIALSLAALFILDTVYSIKTAFDITKVFEAYVKISKEISEMASDITDEAKDFAREKLDSLSEAQDKLLKNLGALKRAHLRGNPAMGQKSLLGADMFKKFREELLTKFSR